MAVQLNESTWTSFTKDLIKKFKLDPKLKLDDAALIKALAGFDKTDESKPEPRRKALGELIKELPEQVKALVKRKKELGDKPFGELKDKLYELLGEAESLHKAATAKAAEGKAAPPKGKDDEDADEEAGNVLLEPKRLLGMLQRCKRDPELSMNFGFVDAKDKQPAIFAMHPRMSGKKLYEALRARVPMLDVDRPSGPDIEVAMDVLRELCRSGARLDGATIK